MQSSLAEIKALLEQIKNELPALLQRSQIAPVQIVIAEGLSDISRRLGLVQAGEFRAGNAVEPGHGFTGVRIGYPPFSYNNELWHIAGVNNDGLEFGVNATNGKALFAGGLGIIDSIGLTLRGSDYPTASALIQWKDSNGVITGQMVDQYLAGTAGNLWIEAVRRSGEAAFVSLITSPVGGAGGASPMTVFQLQSDGQAIVSLEGGTLTGAGQQSFAVKTKPAITNAVNSILYLDTNIPGSAANGLGTALVLRAKNSAGAMTTIGYISAVYTDVTSGSEDSKIMAGYMVAGTLTEKQLAP